MSENFSDDSSPDEDQNGVKAQRDKDLALTRDPSVLEDLARVFVNQDLDDDTEIDAFDHFEIASSVENALQSFLTLTRMKKALQQKVDTVKNKKDKYVNKFRE